MSPSPAPGLVNDWFTWGGVLFTIAVLALPWVTMLILTPSSKWHKPSPEAAAPVPVSPCAPRGHQYRSQPVVWRCVCCGDTRVADGVYDQNAAA